MISPLTGWILRAWQEPEQTGELPVAVTTVPAGAVFPAHITTARCGVLVAPGVGI